MYVSRCGSSHKTTPLFFIFNAAVGGGGDFAIVLRCQVAEVCYEVVSDYFGSISSACCIFKSVSSEVHQVIYCCHRIDLVVIYRLTIYRDRLDLLSRDDQSYLLIIGSPPLEATYSKSFFRSVPLRVATESTLSKGYTA